MMNNLVIKSLIMLIVISCSSVKKQENNDIKEILSLELESHNNFINKEFIEFSLISSDYLKEVLNSNSQIYGHLTKNQAKNILANIDSNSHQSFQLELPKNFLLKKKKTITNESDVSNSKTLGISNPIISDKDNLAVVAFYYGYKNSLEGGIKIYRYKDERWHYVKTFNLWIS